MTTTQLNVRMDSDAKAEGDAVLLSAGISPSHVVRSLWRTISQGRDALSRVMDVLEPEGRASIRQIEIAGEDPAVHGTHLFEEGAARLGISPRTYVADPRPWREMREEAIGERLAERGML